MSPSETVGPGAAPAAWGEGWSDETRVAGAPARRLIAFDGRFYVTAPGDAAFVEVECYAQRRLPIRLTVTNRWVGHAPEFPPYLDVSLRLAPRRWQRLAFPLTVVPQAGEEVEICVGIDGAAPRSEWRRLLTRAQLAVRGGRVRGGQATAAEVAIVVLNWRRAADTIRCLESLAAADLGGARVLVVDNGSGDGSVERLRARFPEQVIVALPDNRGYAGGNNAGIAVALAEGARAVLLLNNDTTVAPDFLPPLLWALNADPRVAAVSSAILRMDHDDLLDVAYLSVYWGHGIVRHHGVNKFPGEGFVNRVDVDVAVGCSVLLSGEALAELGPLDAEYFAYHEEVDWCTRARRAGWRVLYQPLSRVWHAGSQSTGELATPLAVERSAAAAGPELATPIALTWNPVRTYLGARNTVRFVRLNGRLRERLYFWLHSAYAVPLEALAAVMRQEPALKIGAWSYRRALQLYARGFDIPPSPTPPRIGARDLLALPGVLLWRLPRDAARAWREGRLAQIAELLRGLWDGLLGRPLPLERLKLR